MTKSMEIEQVEECNGEKKKICGATENIGT